MFRSLHVDRCSSSGVSRIKRYSSTNWLYRQTNIQTYRETSGRPPCYNPPHITPFLKPVSLKHSSICTESKQKVKKTNTIFLISVAKINKFNLQNGNTELASIFHEKIFYLDQAWPGHIATQTALTT